MSEYKISLNVVNKANKHYHLKANSASYNVSLGIITIKLSMGKLNKSYIIPEKKIKEAYKLAISTHAKKF